MSQAVTIAGGGLAGLSLGIALRHRDIAVTVLEAGSYPRHRVCGEFICGVTPSTLQNLGIADAFEPQVINRDSRWFYRDRPILKKRLPVPAIGISRHHLDRWLADELTRLGGELRTNTRAAPDDLSQEATVWSIGRRRTNAGEWLGLKCHARGFEMDTDLQMHFGKDCYVGLSRVEGDTVNVCGLFKQRRDLKANDRRQLLLAYLRAGQLEQLAEQLHSGDIDPDSLLGVSAFQLGHQSSDDKIAAERLHLGDSYSMIPPFTGNGMTMAFQSAELALQPLTEYAQEGRSWPATVAKIREAHRPQFDRRVRWAMKLHPFLLRPLGQKTLVTLARFHAIPFGLFFNKTR